MTYSNPAGYERFMGRWSARLAPLFVRFAGVEDGQRVLDVGAGTGSLSRALLALGSSVRVAGVDPAASYVAFAHERLPDGRAQFRVASAELLPFPDAAFDATLSLLVLQDITDLAGAVREMARVTRCGGTVAACRWDFGDGLPMLSLFWEAAEAVAPERVARYRESRPSRPGSRATLEELTQLWAACGLEEVRTAALDLSMTFSSFEGYWLPFLGAATPSSALAAAIDDETGGALARCLRAKITCLRPDGSFVLPARAWALAGRVK